MTIQKTVVHYLLSTIILISLPCYTYADTSRDASTAASPNTTSATPKAEQSYSENNLTITATSKHPTFTIKLKSNPTTGYSWFLTDYNTSLLTPIRHQFEKSSAELMGAPGYQIWTFKVNPAGFTIPRQTTIQFNYTRPWQAETDVKQLTFRVFIGS